MFLFLFVFKNTHGGFFRALNDSREWHLKKQQSDQTQEVFPKLIRTLPSQPFHHEMAVTTNSELENVHIREKVTFLKKQLQKKFTSG